MWDCAKRKSAGPVRAKPADRPGHVRLPWLVYPVKEYEKEKRGRDLEKLDGVAPLIADPPPLKLHQ